MEAEPQLNAAFMPQLALAGWEREGQLTVSTP